MNSAPVPVLRLLSPSNRGEAKLPSSEVCRMSQQNDSEMTKNEVRPRVNPENEVRPKTVPGLATSPYIRRGRRIRVVVPRRYNIVE